LLLTVALPEDELGMSAGKLTTLATAIVEPVDKAAARTNLFMKYPSDGVDGHDQEEGCTLGCMLTVCNL
jgi:hypothetical protein